MLETDPAGRALRVAQRNLGESRWARAENPGSRTAARRRVPGALARGQTRELITERLVKILLVADSYIGTDVFKEVFGAFEGEHDVRYGQVDESRNGDASAPAEQTVHEYLGTPAQIA